MASRPAALSKTSGTSTRTRKRPCHRPSVATAVRRDGWRRGERLDAAGCLFQQRVTLGCGAWCAACGGVGWRGSSKARRGAVAGVWNMKMGGAGVQGRSEGRAQRFCSVRWIGEERSARGRSNSGVRRHHDQWQRRPSGPTCQAYRIELPRQATRHVVPPRGYTAPRPGRTRRASALSSGRNPQTETHCAARLGVRAPVQ